jgi:hypothetical protein
LNYSTRNRIWLLFVASILVLAVALLYRRPALLHREISPKSARTEASAQVEPLTLSEVGPEAEQQQSPTPTLPDESSRDEDRAEARGTGYVWGTALRVLFASATIGPDGTKELDVSNLKRSYQGFSLPVELADASASPTLRAEYLAGAITAALDRPTAEQPAISKLLEHYYEADHGSSGLDEKALADQRSRLSREARSDLEMFLPEDSRAEFRESFASPEFLFVTMCATADRIILQADTGTSIATGNATVTIGTGSSFKVSANGSMMTRLNPEKVKKP